MENLNAILKCLTEGNVESANILLGNVPLQETTYSYMIESVADNSLTNIMIEACALMLEADASDDQKVSKIKAMMDTIHAKLAKEDMETFIKTGAPIKILTNLILQLGNVVLIHAGLINPWLSIIGSILSLSHTIVYETGDTKYAKQYLIEIADVKKGLIQMQKKVDKDSKEYKSITKQIERADNLTKYYTEYNAKLEEAAAKKAAKKEAKNNK